MHIPEIANLPDVLKQWEPVWDWARVIGGPFLSTFLKRLLRRYEDDPIKTQEIAFKNAGGLLWRIELRLQKAVDAGLITEDEIFDRLSDPVYAKPFQRLLLDASESSDNFTHDRVAALLAERLVSVPGSRRDHMLGLAADKILQVSSQQAKLLGLIYTIQYVGPWDLLCEERGGLEAYVDEIDRILSCFDGVEYNDIDVRHLFDVGFARHLDHDPVSSRMFSPLICAPDPPPNVSQRITAAQFLRLGRRPGQQIGFDSVELTQIGTIVGEMTYRLIRNEDIVLDAGWDEPESPMS